MPGAKHNRQVPTVTAKSLQQKWSKAVKTNDVKTMLKIGGKLLQTLEKRHSSFALHRIEVLEQLAELKSQTGNYRDAGSYYYALRHLDAKLYGEFSLEVFQDDVHLAEIALAQGLVEDALKLYKEIKSQAAQLLDRNNPYFAVVLNNLGGIYFAQRDFLTARRLFEQAFKINRTHYNRQHKSIVINLYNAGLAYEALKYEKNARANYQEAYALAGKVLSPDDPVLEVLKGKIG